MSDDFDELERRVARLEKDSHPPIDLRPAIRQILSEKKPIEFHINPPYPLRAVDTDHLWINTKEWKEYVSHTDCCGCSMCVAIESNQAVIYLW